ncbi:hypothetical protein D3C76_1780740 [compost metagenome]
MLSECFNLFLFLFGKLVQIVFFYLLQDCLKIIVLFCCCLINVGRMIAYATDNVAVLVASLAVEC